MKRKLALDAIRAAGYENDRRAFTRLYVENRVSFAAAQAAFNAGRCAADRSRQWRIRSLFGVLWQGKATGEQNALDLAHQSGVNTFGLTIFVERVAP